MSDWLVHFTKTQDNLQSIIKSLAVEASGPFGRAKDFEKVRESQKSACLSEIPLDHLQRLYRQHGRWGIGFRKDFVTAAGGGRVWHVQRDSELDRALFGVYGEQMSDTVSGFWQLTPFMDTLGPNYNFDWEREWRVPGGLAFTEDEIGFVVTPDEADSDQVTVKLWRDSSFRKRGILRRSGRQAQSGSAN